MAKDDPKARIPERAEREKVKFMRIQFTDILGVIKNVEVPDRQFEEALDGRIMFDGSSIEGFVRIEESDMYLKPDLGTFEVFPWRFRFVVKNVANRNGLHATFMPKPVFGVNGSGMHTHQSLFAKGRNVFFDPNGDGELSATCLQYIGGLLRHARGADAGDARRPHLQPLFWRQSARSGTATFGTSRRGKSTDT